ncbi:MAG: hypothetical protein ABJR05_07510 [Balneola sp.]
MKKNSFYNEKDFPGIKQKEDIWSTIEPYISSQEKDSVRFHWNSFWIGNAAAVVLLFALVGIYSTIENFGTPSTNEEQVYETLSTATKKLQDLTPLLIQSANEQNRNSIESTADAIAEIDRLIEEIKNDITINGSSPSKEHSLKRLYATKLDFYKEILLNQEEQS